ncbi:MAG: cache and HAMP domain-containing protein [Cocleimonas sp.]|nr:cache and HAMP domain-containing protein [Cocleimonas sp.]
MNSIKNKLLVVLLLVTLLPTLIIGGYTFLSTTDSLKESSLSAQKNKMLLIQEQIHGYLDNVSSDVFYLRDFPALHLYLSALASDNSHSERLLLTNLRSSFAKFSAQKKIYGQVRFIDTSGKEIVRVNHKDDKTKIVSTTHLKFKKLRGYVQKALALKHGSLLITPLELNREGGKIEVPYNPTIRFSTAVFDKKNKRQGIVVLNVKAQHIIEMIKSKSSNGEQLFFINNKGDYYYHPDALLAWSSEREFNKTANLFSEHGELKNKLLHHGAVQNIETDDNIVTFAPIDVSNEKFPLGTVVSIVPKNIIFQTVSNFLYVFLLVALFALILTLALAFFLSNSISKPLVQLTENVEKLSMGDLETPITIDSKDEIGTLAKAVELLRKSMQILMKRASH